MITKVHKDNFEQEVLKSDKPVLVDFWAVWCGPCKIMEPILNELSHDFAGKAKIVKLNVDENPEIAGQFGIMSIPTMLIFKSGQPVDSLIGAMPLEKVAAKINEHSQ